ncbi:hypothetical protein Tco_1525669 [Tanacetum coccineum]
MANESNEVRDAILRRLRTEQEKKVILVNNLLGEMTRYLLQKLSRVEKETRVRSLPLDEPLNNYGLHTLLMTSESDTRITTTLEAVREEVLRTNLEALVQKLIDEDNGRQNAILDLALQFETSCTAKDDLKKAYEKCNDISQESRALIDSFLKEGFDKDYMLGNLSMVMKEANRAAMILANVSVFTPKPSEHYLNITKKNVVKVFRKDTVPTAKSSYPTIEESVEEYKYLTEGGLTEDELHQLAKDEEALKEVLEEEAKREKENAIYNKKLEEYWKEEQAHDELFRMEFGVKSDSKYETD